MQLGYRCPICNGEGKIQRYYPDHAIGCKGNCDDYGCPTYDLTYDVCMDCGGSGIVDYGDLVRIVHEMQNLDNFEKCELIDEIVHEAEGTINGRT